MKSTTTKPQLSQSGSDTVHLFDGWFDPIETEVRERARGFIEELFAANSTRHLHVRAMGDAL